MKQQASNTITWTPGLSTSLQNPYKQQNLSQTDFLRDTAQTGFNLQSNLQTLNNDKLRNLTQGPLYNQGVQQQYDQVSAHSTTSNVNPTTLNYQLKSQIRELKNIQQDITKKTGPFIEQQSLSFIQKSFDQIKEHVQLQQFMRMKEFIASREIIQFKSSNHATEEKLHALQKCIDDVIHEATQVVQQGNDDRKELLIKEMQEIQAQCLDFIEHYEPVEFDFDVNDFKNDFDALIRKHLRVKFSNGGLFQQQLPNYLSQDIENRGGQKEESPYMGQQIYKRSQNQYPASHQDANEKAKRPRSQVQPNRTLQHQQDYYDNQQHQYIQSQSVAPLYEQARSGNHNRNATQRDATALQQNLIKKDPFSHDNISPIRQSNEQQSQDELSNKQLQEENEMNNQFYDELEHSYEDQELQDHYHENNQQQRNNQNFRQNDFQRVPIKQSPLSQADQMKANSQQMSPQQQQQNPYKQKQHPQSIPQSNQQQQHSRYSNSQPWQENQAQQVPNHHQISQQLAPNQYNKEQPQQHQQQQQNTPKPIIKERKTFVDEKGNAYDGEVLQGTFQKEGHGEIKYAADGTFYKGEFKNNMRHGRGEVVMSNGDKFSGEWANDMKHGYGKMEFVSTGIVYYGQYACDKMHGMGTMSGPENFFYNGEWKNGKQHGKGIRKYEDKSSYEGFFEQGVRCGIGKLVMKDGTVFDGQWKNDKKNGPGILQYADGSILRATWVDDILQGRGELERANGKSVVGEWKDNQLVKVIQEK